MTEIQQFGIDTNILVYADDSSSPYNLKSKSYLEGALKGDLEICLSHQILAEYFSVITSPKAVRSPLAVEDAEKRVLFLNKTRAFKKIYPKRSTLKKCVKFCARKNIGGPRIFDALYAMTLLENKVHKLITQNIKDFIPFKELGLDAVNPFSTVERHLDETTKNPVSL